MKTPFEIKQRKRDGHYTVSDRQFHNYYEINYLLSGERFYFIKDRTYSMKKGEMVFIGIYDLHKTSETPQARHDRISLHFTEEFLESLAPPSMRDVLLSPFQREIRLIRFNIHEQSFLEGMLFALLKESRHPQSGSELYIRALMSQLLVYIHRIAASETSSSYEHASPLHKKISEITEYINAHYEQPLTLGGLSESFFISPYYLCRRFKQITGFTLVEYINNVRVKEAQRLLRESKLKVTQIAEHVGFESIVHFGRVFKRFTSLSPMEYKKTRT